MHELSLAMNMREIIEEQSAQEPFSRVTKVILEVGQLSHVEADAMNFAFQSAMKDSCAENAELIIETLAGQARCPQCNTLNTIDHLYSACLHCGAFGLKVIQGDRVQIKSLEVE